MRKTFRGGFSAAAVWMWCGLLPAQSSYYAAGITGISTLSADGRYAVTPGNAATSLYKPENGPLLSVLAGVHLNGYLSAQGGYTWNRNDVTLVSTVAAEQGSGSGYEQARNSRQQGPFGDVLLYFRNRHSWVRPYLSAGIGAAFLRSEVRQVRNVFGSPALPPAVFSAVTPGFRSTAGIDLRLRSRFGFRYSFAETIQRNDFSHYLSPPGQRRLEQFQNLFGFLISFHGL